jgi:hypothetical protein
MAIIRAETRCVWSVVGRQMELDKKSCVGLCACELCAVQSSSKTEDNWTWVCAANQPSPSRATSSINIGHPSQYVTEKRIDADLVCPIRP